MLVEYVNENCAGVGKGHLNMVYLILQESIEIDLTRPPFSDYIMAKSIPKKKPAIRGVLPRKVIKKKPAMKKPSSWIPKRGLARLKKRPACHEKRQQDELYTRSTSKTRGLRRENLVPLRSTNDFITFRRERDIVRILKHDEIISTLQKTDKRPIVWIRDDTQYLSSVIGVMVEVSF